MSLGCHITCREYYVKKDTKPHTTVYNLLPRQHNNVVLVSSIVVLPR